MGRLRHAAHEPDAAQLLAELSNVGGSRGHRRPGCLVGRRAVDPHVLDLFPRPPCCRPQGRLFCLGAAPQSVTCEVSTPYTLHPTHRVSARGAVYAWEHVRPSIPYAAFSPVCRDRASFAPPGFVPYRRVATRG